MLFVDYTFTLLPDGSILLDPELCPKSLKVETGDKFEVVLGPDNGVFFKKLNPLDKPEGITSLKWMLRCMLRGRFAGTGAVLLYCLSNSYL